MDSFDSEAHFNATDEAMKTIFHVLGAALMIGALAGAAPIPEPTTSGPPSMSAIASKMNGVVSSLIESMTGEPVQKEQKVILNDLDDLIAELEKQCQACRDGIARNRPANPSPDSNPHGGAGGIGDLVEPADGDKDWTKLSPRERDRILQSMSEGFPPEYRSILERYYRRLAEETPAATEKEETP